MKPREINPECIDDDAWWDIEALKLAVINPESYRIYSSNWTGASTGHRGLWELRFLTSFPVSTMFDEARVANFGSLLMHACQRVSKCK